jgi:putative addiction module component (TIGR02574 family)
LGGTRKERLMAKSVAELFQDAEDLDERERATLAGLLLESLETERDPDVEQAWATEIERRVAQIDAGEVKLIPWEEVKDRLLGRLESKR